MRDDSGGEEAGVTVAEGCFTEQSRSPLAFRVPAKPKRGCTANSTVAISLPLFSLTASMTR